MKRLLLILLLALSLPGCRQSYDYYNPLDPAEDAALSTILDFIDDPAIRQAITDSGATTKRDLHWLWVSRWEHGTGDPITSMEGLEYLSFTQGLTLHDAGLPGNPDVDLGPLVKMRSLRELDLAGNLYNNTTVATIPYIPTLVWLSLHGNDISDAGAVVPLLKKYRRGQLNLDIAWNSGMDASTLVNLNPALDRLWGLHVGGMDDNGTLFDDLSFLPVNDTLTFLSVSGNRNLSDFGGLTRLSSLRDLSAWDSEMDDARFGTIPVSVLSRLSYLGIGNNAFTNLGGIVSRLESVSLARGQLNLGIGGNPVGADDLNALTPVLDRLHWLGFEWWHHEGESGPLVDLSFLPSGGNDTIVGLNLSGNGLTDISGISRLQRLEYLYLERIPTEFVSGSSALLDLPRLRELQIWDSPGFDEAVLVKLEARGVWVGR